jgi:hypothetical protein
LDKIQYKAKDETTRKFIRQLALPRRFKYQNSVFHLDFFNISTWANTNELPKEKIKGALVIKNASKKPVNFVAETEEDLEAMAVLKNLPSDYYISYIKDYAPKTITIAFEEEYDYLKKVQFPFIKEDPKEKLAHGVKIADNIKWDDID